MILFLLLFYTFFIIGLVGFGGGYAMISMIQGEVVTRYHWLTSQQFTDIIAISQMTPGPIGINSATYVGYTAAVNAGYPHWVGILGSVTATVAVVLPSFILMYTITRLLIKYRETSVVESMFAVIRPTVVGLIASAALILMNAENFSTPDINPWQFYISVFLFVSAFIGTHFFKINLIPKQDADEAMDCATCIGCGACVAACKNGSAMLFVSSKVSQLALLPQGRPEAAKRVKAMIAKMDELGFGNCTNTRACEAVCPKNETVANIARLNREFLKAKLAD